MVPTVLILAVAFVLAQPAAALARPERGAIVTECPTLVQAANVLRLSTPAQTAAYRDRLPAGCRERLLAEAREIIASHGQFFFWGEHIIVPADFPDDHTGPMPSEHQNGWGLEKYQTGDDISRDVVGRGLLGAGAVLQGLGALLENGPMQKAGTVLGAVGTLLELAGGGKDHGGGGNGGGDQEKSHGEHEGR